MKNFAAAIIGFVSGWAAVTVIYVAALFVESRLIHLGLVALVAIIVAIYAVIVGVPAYLLSKGIGLASGRAYVGAGLVASIPMLTLCIANAEYGYSAITVFAGATYGAAMLWAESRFRNGTSHGRA